ncbi:hypothetical protein DMENIID0001_071370 [Sergentomyia squamirostris]
MKTRSPPTTNADVVNLIFCAITANPGDPRDLVTLFMGEERSPNNKIEISTKLCKESTILAHGVETMFAHNPFVVGVVGADFRVKIA